jgi:hypothetical protein
LIARFFGSPAKSAPIDETISEWAITGRKRGIHDQQAGAEQYTLR